MTTSDPLPPSPSGAPGEARPTKSAETPVAAVTGEVVVAAADSPSFPESPVSSTAPAGAIQVHDGPREFPLHPQHARLWFWQSVLTAAVIALPSLIALSVLFRWKGSLLAIAFALLVARLMIAYGHAYARRFRCALLDDGLLIEQGVFWRRQTFVPRARVQHTDVDQGPLERALGMATLKVFTAGTHEVKLQVEGIGRDSALQLRDALLARHGHDGV